MKSMSQRSCELVPTTSCLLQWHPFLCYLLWVAGCCHQCDQFHTCRVAACWSSIASPTSIVLGRWFSEECLSVYCPVPACFCTLQSSGKVRIRARKVHLVHCGSSI